jgi:hypothetical protein
LAIKTRLQFDLRSGILLVNNFQKLGCVINKLTGSKMNFVTLFGFLIQKSAKELLPVLSVFSVAALALEIVTWKVFLAESFPVHNKYLEMPLLEYKILFCHNRMNVLGMFVCRNSLSKCNRLP